MKFPALRVEFNPFSKGICTIFVCRLCFNVQFVRLFFAASLFLFVSDSYLSSIAMKRENCLS